MIVVTEDNFESVGIDFEGILISVPKVDLLYNAEFYFYGHRIDQNNKHIYTITGYNMEDGCINGISTISEISIESMRSIYKHLDTMNYYLFDNMKEFCEWYLHKDDKLNESIDKFVEEVKNSPFKSVELPEEIKDKFTQDIIINHYKVDDKSINNLYPPQIKRKDKYRDLIEYIELYIKWALMSREPNITLGEIKPVYDKIQEWLEGEIDD